MDGVIPLCVESCDHPEEVEDDIPDHIVHLSFLAHQPLSALNLQRLVLCVNLAAEAVALFQLLR